MNLEDNESGEAQCIANYLNTHTGKILKKTKKSIYQRLSKIEQPKNYYIIIQMMEKL